MKMSAACSMPAPRESTAEERAHPRHAEYLRYRSALRSRLVAAVPSFHGWLESREEFENGRVTTFQVTSPLAALPPGWYSHIFAPRVRDPYRLGPFDTEAQAEAAVIAYQKPVASETKL